MHPRPGEADEIESSGGGRLSAPDLRVGRVRSGSGHGLPRRVDLDGAARPDPVREGRLSPPTGHMRFPGTITTPDEVFQKVLESAARSFRLHGFRDVVLLGDHGGAQADQKAVAERLNREWAATPVRVHAIEEYYQITQREYVQALKSRGYRDEEIGTHAGLADTSLMLALDPRLVRMERLGSGTKLGSADGVQGDPRRSSASLGRLGVDAIVSQTADAIKKAVVRRPGKP